MAKNRRARKLNGAVPIGHQKPGARMGLRACDVAMVSAQIGLYLAHGLLALSARLALPEHDEALSAYTALQFAAADRAFAKYLHFSSPHIIGPPTTKTLVPRRKSRIFLLSGDARTGGSVAYHALV